MNIPIILPPPVHSLTPALRLIKEICDKAGRLDERMLRELGREFPGVPVLVKWEDGTHTAHHASTASALIAQSTMRVREIIFNKFSMEVLADCLGERN